MPPPNVNTMLYGRMNDPALHSTISCNGNDLGHAKYDNYPVYRYRALAT